MKINLQQLITNKAVNFEEDIDFSSYEFDPTYIRGIPTCHVKAEATQYEDLLRIYCEIEAKVIGVCAYTLEDVELPIKVKDEIDFTDDPDDDSCELIEGTVIDLDEKVLALVLSQVPPKVVKKGAKLPESGNGYRVLTEDELAKERENKTDSRWAALDDLDL